MVGESTTALPGMSSFWWINALHGGPLAMLQNLGVGSETIQGCLARINNSHTDTPPGLAGLAPMGWCFLRVGGNNAFIEQPFSAVAADFASLIAIILTYCTRIFVFPVQPLYTNTPYPNDYNANYAAVCAADPTHLTYVDDCALMHTGDIQDSQYFADGIHFNGLGVYTAGITGAADATLTSLLAQYTASPLIKTPAPAYPAQPQWVTNPLMSGTSGTVGTGFTGVMADGWEIARTGGVTAVCSKVAADADDPNQTPWQRIAPTGAGGSGIDITTTLAGRTITATDPATLEVVIEIRFNALNTFVLFDFYCEVKHSDAGLLSPRAYLNCSGAGVVTQTAVLRTAIPRDNASTHADAIFHLHCGSEQDHSPNNGTVDFRCVSAIG